jgi:hypothetical protein
MGVEVADLHAWRDDHYAPERLILVAAGKLEHDALVDLAEEAFGDMARRRSRRSSPAPSSAAGAPRTARHAGPSRLAMPAPNWGRIRYASQLFADVAGTGARRGCSRRCARTGLAYRLRRRPELPTVASSGSISPAATSSTGRTRRPNASSPPPPPR